MAEEDEERLFRDTVVELTVKKSTSSVEGSAMAGGGGETPGR
jgi:hypothetical protein